MSILIQSKRQRHIRVMINHLQILHKRVVNAVGPPFSRRAGFLLASFPVIVLCHRQGLKSVYPLRSVRIFGSCAEGRAAANSDLDLLVEVDAPAVSLVKRNAPKKKRTHISAGSCGADDQIRTGDLILTKDALYRLSYISISCGNIDIIAHLRHNCKRENRLF